VRERETERIKKKTMSDSALEDLSLESPKSEEYSLGSSEDATTAASNTTTTNNDNDNNNKTSEVPPAAPERHHHHQSAEIPVLPVE